MKKLILTILLASALWSLPEAGVMSNFFKSAIPQDSMRLELKPAVAISAMRLNYSRIKGRIFNEPVFYGNEGVGIVMQLTVKKFEKIVGKDSTFSNYAKYSISGLVFRDLSACCAFGLFNNMLCLGGGIKLGFVPMEESRYFITVYHIVNITNNPFNW